MAIKSGIALFAAAAIVLAAAGGAAAQASAHAKPGFVIDFSAQQNKKGKKGAGKKAGQPQKAGRQQKAGHPQKKSVSHTGNARKSGGKKTIVIKKPGTPGVGHKNKTGNKNIGVIKKTGPGGTKAVVVVPKGSGKVTAKRMRGLSRGKGQASVRGRNFSTWRGGRYRTRYRNRWVTFVPLAALTAILIGENRYYPYAYISAPIDYCEGITEDGCDLRWREVETIEGDRVGQCVAYCPWQD
jgi:hypothetical protein